MRIIRYIGNDAICKAFSKQTGITWTTGMTATVLDDKVAAEMLKHPTVFVDASNASDPVSAQAAAIAAVEANAAFVKRNAAGDVTGLTTAGGELLKNTLFSFFAPSGFGWEPPVSIWMNNDSLETDFVSESWMVPAVATLWVSISRGSDTTGNGSFETPYKSIWKAISVMTAATTVYIEAGTYDRNYCWKAQAPQYPINVIAVGGKVISSLRWEGGTWTLTTNGTYQATRSIPAVVTDDAFKDDFGVTSRLKKVASQALCEAEAGTWANDATTIWVHTQDGRAPDANVLVYLDQANGYTNTAVSGYVRGITFEGGLSAFVSGSTKPTASTTWVFDRCDFRFSKQTAGSFVGLGIVITHKCRAYGAGYDGFAYTIGVNTVSPKAVEIFNSAFSNGDPSDTTDNDNASTSHNACRVVRIGCTGYGTYGPIFADIDSAKSWNIACYAGRSLSENVPNQNSGFQALGTAEMWLDRCVSDGSSNKTYSAAGATIYGRRSDIGDCTAY